MSEHTAYVLEELRSLSSLISTSTTSALAEAQQRMLGTRLGEGTFTTLELGQTPLQLANGVSQRAADRLAELQERFDRIADRLEENRQLYEQTETENVESTRGII